MSLRVRAMQFYDVQQVRDITARCHPELPERPNGWFFAHPTLVLAQQAHGGPKVFGHTSFTIDVLTNTMQYLDVCVDPIEQGKGYASRLFEEREAWGHAMGVEHFLGCTRETNVPMLRIFERMEYHGVDDFPYPLAPGFVVFAKHLA